MTFATLVRTARRLLQANVAPGTDAGIATYHPLRRTTGRAEAEERLWVYGRARRPCRRCRTPIERRKQGTGCPEHLLVPGVSAGADGVAPSVVSLSLKESGGANCEPPTS